MVLSILRTPRVFGLVSKDLIPHYSCTLSYSVCYKTSITLSPKATIIGPIIIGFTGSPYNSIIHMFMLTDLLLQPYPLSAVTVCAGGSKVSFWRGHSSCVFRISAEPVHQWKSKADLQVDCWSSHLKAERFSIIMVLLLSWKVTLGEKISSRCGYLPT